MIETSRVITEINDIIISQRDERVIKRYIREPMVKLIINVDHTGGSTGNETIRFVEVEFFADNNTKVKDLFPFLDSIVQTKDLEKTTCTRFCHFMIQNTKVTAIDDFNLLLFLELNNIDFDKIRIDYCYAGTGGSEYINDKLKFFIPSSEKNHLDSPHIHISNCKGDNAVVFYLSSLNIRDGKDNWDRYFTKKEKKSIIKCLRIYQKKFTIFYNELSKGIVPSPVEFTFDNSRKTYVLSQSNDTH